MPRQRPSTTRPIENERLAQLASESVGIEHHRPTSRVSPQEILGLIASTARIPVNDSAYETMAVVPEAAQPAPLVVLPEEPDFVPPPRPTLAALALLGVAFITVIIAVVLVVVRS